jgi:hypothetical protein
VSIGGFRSFTRSYTDYHEFSLRIDHLGLTAGMCDDKYKDGIFHEDKYFDTLKFGLSEGERRKFN